MTLTGVRAAPLPSLNAAIRRVLELLYWGIPRPTKPILPEYLSKSDRNQQICARYVSGESIADLAREYEISDQRVFQIIHRLKRL
jgi:hypothetical protein